MPGRSREVRVRALRRSERDALDAGERHGRLGLPRSKRESSARCSATDRLSRRLAAFSAARARDRPERHGSSARRRRRRPRAGALGHRNRARAGQRPTVTPGEVHGLRPGGVRP